MRPLRLLPLLQERPWGVRSLAPWVPGPTQNAPIGEAWFTANETQTDTGATLGELIAADAPEVLGGTSPDGRCPLLLKLLFTSERLSVQVHPDDEYAARHHDSRGKTEAWHVLEAAAGAEVGLGFVRGISRSEAVRAARTGEIAGLLDWRSTRRGDTWLVPAGTVHAIGAGLTIAEIQEQSDITYRIYDYGRPRELHLERGFDVAELGPYAPADGRAISLGPSRQELTRCRYFRLERWQLRGSLRYSPARDDLFHLLMVVGGRGEYRGQPFGPGATWLVPARCDAETWQLDGEVLLMYASESPTSAFATQDDGGR